jgi:hypothetical protein
MFDTALHMLPLIHADMLQTRTYPLSLRFCMPYLLDLTLFFMKAPSFMSLPSRTHSRVYSPYLVP